MLHRAGGDTQREVPEVLHWTRASRMHTLYMHGSITLFEHAGVSAMPQMLNLAGHISWAHGNNARPRGHSHLSRGCRQSLAVPDGVTWCIVALTRTAPAQVLGFMQLSNVLFDLSVWSHVNLATYTRRALNRHQIIQRTPPRKECSTSKPPPSSTRLPSRNRRDKLGG